MKKKTYVYIVQWNVDIYGPGRIYNVFKFRKDAVTFKKHFQVGFSWADRRENPATIEKWEVK